MLWNQFHSLSVHECIRDATPVAQFRKSDLRYPPIWYLIQRMLRAIQLAVLAVSLVALADASSSCPVTLISGGGDPDAIIVTFRNAGKLPIRQLEFNCTPIHAQSQKTQRGLCLEKNALFFPGMEYTGRYTYPGGIPGPVLVSLKSVTLSDGYIWKPSQRQPCRVLKIYPGKTKK